MVIFLDTLKLIVSFIQGSNLSYIPSRLYYSRGIAHYSNPAIF
jgi:hypothetical protein